MEIPGRIKSRSDPLSTMLPPEFDAWKSMPLFLAKKRDRTELQNEIPTLLQKPINDLDRLWLSEKSTK